MKLTFLGATHEVTGSCTLVEICGHYGIVDYGMEQGKNVFVNKDLPVPPSELEFILLTHAHVDHSGMLPLLYKNGCKCSIYATRETCMLSNIMLRDCAHIQESEAEYDNRKAERAGRPTTEPLFTTADAEIAISHLRPCTYGTKVTVAEGMIVRFVDAGHLLGSASIELFLTEDNITKKVVFSGDIGNVNQQIIRCPQYIEEADYVVTESTYGDRFHSSDGNDSVQYLANCIQKTLDRGGNLVIPSFAVGRTQELLYMIRLIKLGNMVKGHDNFPVYVDSPMATAATNIFIQADKNCFDDDVKALLDKGINPLVFPNLNLTESVDESKLINANKEPKVIISSSGMCDAGRIRHHLKHNLWRKECTVLFVGYQSQGTTGRYLLNGAQTVKLYGDNIMVKAEIDNLPGKSGHADKAGLVRWIDAFVKKPKMVFVNHGDDESCQSYAEYLKTSRGLNTFAPYSGTEFDLLENRFTNICGGIRVEQKTAKQSRNETYYNSLLEACRKLTELCKGMKGKPNTDILWLTDRINNILKFKK